MSRIGTTLNGLELRLLNNLNQVDQQAIVHAIRLATGAKVSRPKDDPSTFLLVSNFTARLNRINQTISQVDVATTIAAEAQLGIDTARTELEFIRELLITDEDQTLTAEDRTTAQLAIDKALDNIDDASGAEINGHRPLDGSFNYNFSGVNTSQVSSVEAFSIAGNTLSGSVSAAATQATLDYKGSGGKIDDDASFTLAGERGSTAITVTKNEQLTDVADRINADSHKTGITASVNGNDLTFTSVDYGDEALVDIDVTSGTFDVTGGDGNGRDTGTDATVTINGQSIDSNQIDGNKVRVYDNGLHATIEFAAGFSGAFDTITITDDNVPKFTLSTEISELTSFALPGTQAVRLGGISGTLNQIKSGGGLDGLGSNTSQAIRIVDEALADLNLVEGRADAFGDVAVKRSSEMLKAMKATVEEAIDQVNGINPEEESLLLTKNQALGSNTISALAVAQQQQLATLALVQQAAGLI